MNFLPLPQELVPSHHSSQKSFSLLYQEHKRLQKMKKSGRNEPEPLPCITDVARRYLLGLGPLKCGHR